MTVQDRTTRGLLAGVIAGSIMASLDVALHQLGLVRFAYFDWALALIYGSTATTTLEAALPVRRGILRTH